MLKNLLNQKTVKSSGEGIEKLGVVRKSQAKGQVRRFSQVLGHSDRWVVYCLSNGKHNGVFTDEEALWIFIFSITNTADYKNHLLQEIFQCSEGRERKSKPFLQFYYLMSFPLQFSDICLHTGDNIVQPSLDSNLFPLSIVN